MTSLTVYSADFLASTVGPGDFNYYLFFTRRKMTSKINYWNGKKKAGGRGAESSTLHHWFHLQQGNSSKKEFPHEKHLVAHVK